MKSNKRNTCFKLENIFCQIWMALVLVVFVNNTDAIRIYEGTNFPAPTPKIQKSLGLTKKSLYISKRSWNAEDENLKSSAKLDRKLERKYRDFNKRTMDDETPSLYKIKFTDKNYMQYLKYIKEVPRLEEYTFCLWYKPTNLTHDQTLFFYSINKNEVLLRFWINAIDSTFRMAIRENIVYKVPAIIREHKWHHICQSWNGILGELQIFLDGKRIGAGVLIPYKGTYIPEGGEVTLGQDIMGLEKKLDDELDGEIFGFNLVDESVPHDQANFINIQYRPNVQAFVPPFKKLPPMKKTYQEIKAYVSALPSDISEVRKKNEAFRGEEPNSIKKHKEPYSIPPKRIRGNHRTRYPPLRKVVVYNRDDRQLDLNETLLELNKTNPILLEKNTFSETIKNQTSGQKLLQPYDENYSIHSYRFGKQGKKNTNYEIYEAIEDDTVKPSAEDKLTDEELLKRKARQNFNLFTAREANKVYTLSSSVKDLRKPKFHFETRTEDPLQLEETNRRSFTVEESKAKIIRKPVKIGEKRRITDTIPVYEIEISEVRRKRNADEERKSRQFPTVDPLVGTKQIGFRRLPQIPETFINLFTKNSSKYEIEEKLDQFFPKSDSKEESNIVTEVEEISTTYPTITDKTLASPETTTILQTAQKFSEERKTTKRVTESPETLLIPVFSPIPSLEKTSHIKRADYLSILSNPTPINVAFTGEQFRDFNPRRPFEEMPSRDRFIKPGEEKELIAERKKFDISSGTDLVMRSYGECTAQRGSPIEDKQRLIISWADTPVRLFGGAQVESAKNECGNF